MDMLLAIEAGNTNIKFALVNDDGTPRARWRIATDARRTADEYAVWLIGLIELEGLDRSAVKAVAISTVVPRALHNLQTLAEKYFGVTATVAGRAPLEYGIALDVDEPHDPDVLREQPHRTDRHNRNFGGLDRADHARLVLMVGQLPGERREGKERQDEQRLRYGGELCLARGVGIKLVGDEQDDRLLV